MSQFEQKIVVVKQINSPEEINFIGNQKDLFITFLVGDSRVISVVFSIVMFALFLCHPVGDKKGKHNFKTAIKSPSV